MLRHVVFIETNAFIRSRGGLISEDELQKLQVALLLNPETGPVIPGSGGLRKMRWAASGRGKRGGARVIYYWRNDRDQIYLLLAYAKNVQENLTPQQLKVLKTLMEE